MKNYIDIKIVMNAELLLRFCMVVTMLVAGISKFSSNGKFHDYYLLLFSNDNLRIQMPISLIDIYLTIIPFVEIAIGIGLIWTKFRRYFIIIWVLYFVSLEVGHYILEEWLAVDAMIPLILLGVITYIFPAHQKIEFGSFKQL